MMDNERQAYWIKPLKWKKSDDTVSEIWTAGDYELLRNALDDWGWRSLIGPWKFTKSAKAAKSAAEEHHRTRLLAALEPAPTVPPSSSAEKPRTSNWRNAIGCAPAIPGSISAEAAVRKGRDEPRGDLRGKGSPTPYEPPKEEEAGEQP